MRTSVLPGVQILRDGIRHAAGCCVLLRCSDELHAAVGQIRSSQTMEETNTQVALVSGFAGVEVR